jgi:hypothetical protein
MAGTPHAQERARELATQALAVAATPAGRTTSLPIAVATAPEAARPEHRRRGVSAHAPTSAAAGPARR